MFLTTLTKKYDAVCITIIANAYQIALSSQPIHDKLPVDLYVEAVQELTKSPTGDHRGGLFFITSCNFTEQELTAKFGPAGA